MMSCLKFRWKARETMPSSRILNYGVEKWEQESVTGIGLKKQGVRPLMERFGATEKVANIANPLKEMVGTRRLELLTSTVSIEVQQPVIDSKGVNSRRNRQNRNTRRNLLPNCYQNMASGFGARIVGDRPLHFALNRNIHPCPGPRDLANSARCCSVFLLRLTSNFSSGSETPLRRD